MNKKTKYSPKRLILPSLIVLAAAGILFGMHAYVKWWRVYRSDPCENRLFEDKWIQSGCTHDLSYREPVVPSGKYYPNGDTSAPYYAEVTDYMYFQMKIADDQPYTMREYIMKTDGQTEPQVYNLLDRTWLAEKHEFMVITNHGFPEGGDEVLHWDYVGCCRPQMYFSWKRFIPGVSGHLSPGTVYVGSGDYIRLYYDENNGIVIDDPLTEPLSGNFLIRVDESV